jgi:hypothetical protein
MKKLIRLGGNSSIDDAWTIVLLNGVPVGEVIKWQDATISGHSYLGERGNQWWVENTKTLSEGAKAVAERYIDQLKEQLDSWNEKAVAIGLLSRSTGDQ